LRIEGWRGLGFEFGLLELRLLLLLLLELGLLLLLLLLLELHTKRRLGLFLLLHECIKTQLLLLGRLLSRLLNRLLRIWKHIQDIIYRRHWSCLNLSRSWSLIYHITISKYIIHALRDCLSLRCRFRNIKQVWLLDLFFFCFLFLLLIIFINFDFFFKFCLNFLVRLTA